MDYGRTSLEDKNLGETLTAMVNGSVDFFFFKVFTIPQPPNFLQRQYLAVAIRVYVFDLHTHK